MDCKRRGISQKGNPLGGCKGKPLLIKENPLHHHHQGGKNIDAVKEMELNEIAMQRELGRGPRNITLIDFPLNRFVDCYLYCSIYCSTELNRLNLRYIYFRSGKVT